MAKWLTVLVVIAGVLWGGWWIVGSTAFDRGARVAVDTARTQGWGVEYDDLSVSGFPNRFDVTLDAPQVTTPDGSIRWIAPFLQVFALSYRPNHVIAVAPHEMTVEVPGEAIDIASNDLRASVVVTPSLQPDLQRATLSGTELTIRSADIGVDVASVLFAIRQMGAEPVYDVALTLKDLSPNESLRSEIDPSRSLPRSIEAIDVDAQATLSEPIGAGSSPLLSAMTARRISLDWGDTRLILSGDLVVGADGLPVGDLALRARGWGELLDFVVARGLVSASQAALISSGLDGLKADDGFADIPVSMGDGVIRVMGLAVGTAPRF